MLNRLNPRVADYLATIWRARRFVVIVALLAAGVSIAFSATSERTFESSTLLQVSVAVADDGQSAEFRSGVVAEIAAGKSTADVVAFVKDLADGAHSA